MNTTPISGKSYDSYLKRRSMRAFKPIFLHVILPIIIGGFIYVTYRHNSIEMFNWLELLSLNNSVSLIREYLSPTREFLPDWVVFSLPNSIWVYSFSFTLMLIWGDNLKVAFTWLLLPFLLGSVVEILQYYKYISGTFDYTDLILCVIAIPISILNYKLMKNEKKSFF